MDNKDILIEEIKKIDIPIPESLDESIQETIDRLPVKKSFILKEISRAVAGMIIVIGLLSFFIYSNESFADMVKEVPGLKVLAEMIRGDDGIKNAAKNGYPILDEVVVLQDGYKLILNDILVDEERVSLQGRLFMVDEDMIMKELVASDFSLHLVAPSVSSSSYVSEQYTTFEFGDEANTYIRDLLDEGENLTLSCRISANPRFIDGSSDEFTTEISINDEEIGDDLEFDFLESSRDENRDYVKIENITIPISRETVLLNKEIPIHQTMEFQGGIMEFKQLILSPSQMNLLINTDVEDRYLTVNGQKGKVLGLSIDLQAFSTGGENPTVANGAWGRTVDDKTFKFVPSLYFEDLDTVTFEFSSYYYVLEQKPILIDQDTEFPLKVDYYGHEVVIEDSYVDGKHVVIKSSYLENEDFKYQSLGIKDSQTKTASYSDYQNPEDGLAYKESYMILEDAVEGDSYEIVFEYPQIFVHEGGQLLVPLKEE